VTHCGRYLEQVPVTDPAKLSAVAVPVLVIGAVGDPPHPTEVALAVALPTSRLELIDSPHAAAHAPA
jgi:hypothetical protein